MPHCVCSPRVLLYRYIEIICAQCLCTRPKSSSQSIVIVAYSQHKTYHSLCMTCLHVQHKTPLPPYLLTEWGHCTDGCILQWPLWCGEEAPPSRSHCQHYKQGIIIKSDSCFISVCLLYVKVFDCSNTVQVCTCTHITGWVYHPLPCSTGGTCGCCRPVA